jgi:hypothetical protein
MIDLGAVVAATITVALMVALYAIVLTEIRGPQ